MLAVRGWQMDHGCANGVGIVRATKGLKNLEAWRCAKGKGASEYLVVITCCFHHELLCRLAGHRDAHLEAGCVRCSASKFYVC